VVMAHQAEVAGLAESNSYFRRHHAGVDQSRPVPGRREQPQLQIERSQRSRERWSLGRGGSNRVEGGNERSSAVWCRITEADWVRTAFRTRASVRLEPMCGTPATDRWKNGSGGEGRKSASGSGG